MPGCGRIFFERILPAMPKTAYILGAGFSKPAGFPLQSELYPLVIERMFKPDFERDRAIPIEVLNPVSEFLISAGFVSPDGTRLFELNLEDLFTLMDQIIEGHGNFRGFSWIRLIDVRDKLTRAILEILHTCSEDHLKSDDTRYRKFACHLLGKRISVGVENDPFCIISLNWDSLIEDSVYWVLRETGGISNRAKADIDYCVYTTPLPDSPHTPSTKQKASHIYNLKLLKLHGSCTWLRCPSSNHIYTGLGLSESASSIYVKERESPFMSSYQDSSGGEFCPVLEPYVITPTFAKVFDQPHIQTTWHNAYVELREADEIIIIGYSLPEADYHFRTLLRRAIRTNSEVRVVLSQYDAPTESKSDLPEHRYRRIFSDSQLSLTYDGVEAFIGECLASYGDTDLLGLVRQRLQSNMGGAGASI